MMTTTQCHDHSGASLVPRMAAEGVWCAEDSLNDFSTLAPLQTAPGGRQEPQAGQQGTQPEFRAGIGVPRNRLYHVTLYLSQGSSSV